MSESKRPDIGSPYFDDVDTKGGCCGGVMGGSLNDIGSGTFDVYKDLFNMEKLKNEPLAMFTEILPEAIIVTTILLSILLLIIYSFTDYDMKAYSMSFGIVLAIGVGIRVLTALIKFGYNRFIKKEDNILPLPQPLQQS